MAASQRPRTVPFRFTDFVVNGSDSEEENADEIVGNDSDDGLVEEFGLSSDDNFVESDGSDVDRVDGDQDQDGGAHGHGDAGRDAPAPPFVVWIPTFVPEPDNRGRLK